MQHQKIDGPLNPVTVRNELAGMRSRGTAKPEAELAIRTKLATAKIDKAIREANLGLNPIVDGNLLRLPVPPLTQERRQELIKLAHKYAEQCRVAIRNVRRDGMEALKKLEKDSKISQDEHRSSSAKVQDLTDKLIKEVDQILANKEAEINKI